MRTVPPTSTNQPQWVVNYRRLLVLYPRPFRDAHGADMVQVFGDMVSQMGGGNASRIWPRVLRDVVSSAARQRLAQLTGPRDQRPRARTIFAVVLVVALSIVVGNPLLFPLGLIWLAPGVGAVLFVLPPIGLVLLRRAWVAWRTTGAPPWVASVLGVGCFVPGAWWLIANDGGGWWAFVLIVMALIYGLGLGAIWAIATLVRARHRPTPARKRLTAAVLIATAVLVLGGMAGAGFNSYLKARKPPGDHSAANASSQTRALWDASKSGDVDLVIAMIDACADPFVEFSDGHGSRARTNAEWFAGIKWGNPHPAPEPARSGYFEIIDLLNEAEDTWTQRCNP